jgi:hypothetical protein
MIKFNYSKVLDGKFVAINFGEDLAFQTGEITQYDFVTVEPLFGFEQHEDFAYIYNDIVLHGGLEFNKGFNAVCNTHGETVHVYRLEDEEMLFEGVPCMMAVYEINLGAGGITVLGIADVHEADDDVCGYDLVDDIRAYPWTMNGQPV